MSIAKSILTTLIYIVAIEILGAWILLPDVFHLNTNRFLNIHYILIQGFIQLTAVVLFFYFLLQERPIVSLKRPSLKWFSITLVVGLFFIVFQEVLNFGYNFLSVRQYHVIFDFDGWYDLKNVNLISTVLFIPISEELFFRGYLQKRLTYTFRPFTAIVIASLLFALVHAPYLNLFYDDVHRDWHQFYIAFFGGLIAGGLYQKTHLLALPILFHVLWNLMAVII